jgi:gamma-tubulin complex component 5
MAQNAKISALTDELIQSILAFDPATDKRAYKNAKEIAARGLRGHQYARTNQFDISQRYTGLDEKFRVKGRDDLADALLSRLQKLETITHKFKPEFLSLLLELSDRPLENSQVEALELLRPPSPPPALTWDQILEEDPYSDEEIWNDIDYAVESSGDEQAPKKQKHAKPSPPTSADEDDTFNPESCILPTETFRIEDMKATQFWKSVKDESDTKTEIPELQAIRETLFMLAGLRTSLYQVDKQQNSVRLNPSFTISQVIAGTADHLLSQLAVIGRDIFRLRQWSKRTSSLPLIQTFEAAVKKRLSDFDQYLSQLQQRYLIPETPISVSLLELHHDIRSYAGPLLRLAQVVGEIEPQLLVNPFSHLEELYSQTTLAQMTLEKENFDFFSRLFFDCIQTYLKPIRRWMEAGELGTNDETFFIFESDSESEIASLWHDRFVLRRNGQDKLRSPSFLQPAAQRIFNTGKSVVFLKELDIYKTSGSLRSTGPLLDHETVCGISEDVPLSPFPELFQAAFDTWMRSTYSQASATLREHLFKTSGLMHILSAFQILYLGRNGALFEDFANVIFGRMDQRNRGWNDRYMLTDLARDVFGTALRRSDVEKIVVRSTRTGNPRQSVNGLAAVMIDYAVSESQSFQDCNSTDASHSCRGRHKISSSAHLFLYISRCSPSCSKRIASSSCYSACSLTAQQITSL